MANGRLGKAVIAPNDTVAVYTNSSGAEASVSVVAQADDGANMYLRIDDTSDPLTATTTLVSEAYDERYVQYDAANTGVAGAATYAGRLQFHDPSNVTTWKGVFEYYDAGTATTYTRTSATSGEATIQWSLSWEMYSSEATAPYQLQQTSTLVNYISAYSSPTNAADYYNTIFVADGSPSNYIAAYNMGASVISHGFASDPYETDYAWGIGINGNGYGLGAQYDGSSIYTSTAGTVSTPYYMGLTSATAPSSTYQPPYLRPSKRAYTVDGCNGTNRLMICVPADVNFSAAGVSYADGIIRRTENHMLRVQSLGAAYNGGNVLYHEYNPNDERWYVGYRSASTGYVASYTRAGFIAGIAVGNVNSVTPGTDVSAMDFYHGTLTLPLVTHTLGTAYATYRTMRIGPSLWALVATTFGSTAAAETFYSTDLQTWVAAANYFSPYDYERQDDATTIRSDAGVVSGTKSSILSLGTDGVLENDVGFGQYERTGLVLSNGDRIVAYSGTNSASNISIQVMGYEGN